MLTYVQEYKSFKGEELILIIINLSISLAYLESSNDKKARSAFKYAEKCESQLGVQ